MGNLNVMRSILFLIFILFFNSTLWAETGLKATSDIKINFGDYKSENKDPFSLTTPPDFSFGNTSGTLNWGRPTCSIRTPQYCSLSTSCAAAGGHWDILNSTCGATTCHFGTTAEVFNPTRCKCNLDPYAYVERGNFLQQCPSECLASENKVYMFFSKSCGCVDGYTQQPNGSCVANPTARTQPTGPDCWRELKEKVESCETDSNTADAQCDVAEGDSMSAIGDLLGTPSGNAVENCERAAVAGSSGYHHADDTRRACDERINTCKTGCGDAKTYLNANKERLYNACRERAQQEQVNQGPPLPAERFNPMWDNDNKAALDTEFQNLLTRVDSSHAVCESGNAAKNREKLTTAMGEMNTTSRNASQCVCQLGSTSADCATVVKGPADCKEDPTLPGCAKVADNCFDPKNTSMKCICFRNPESIECKGSLPTINVKNTNDPSSLAGAKPVTDTRGGDTAISGMAAGKTADGIGNVNVGGAGDNYGASADLNSMTAGASESAVSAAGIPNALPPAPATGGGSSSGGGSGAANLNGVAPTVKSDGGVVSKLGGLFENAKSAIGGLFKKNSETGGQSNDYRDGGGRGQGFDPKKFRPRGMVRGIASESDIAGKHEDIWKVMNKQYKVQDQKDNFIFEKN